MTKEIKVTLCHKCPFFNDGNGGEYPYSCNLVNGEIIETETYIADKYPDFCPIKKESITVSIENNEL
jgi:hypothetical protein